MTNYLYPAWGGGGGGGGVASVTGVLPIKSSGGLNPAISTSNAYYDVGLVTDWPYTTIAAAIAAANAAVDLNATIRLHVNVAENVALPRGMALVGINVNGQPIRRLTGQIVSGLGAGTSTVAGLLIVGDGASQITDAHASTNISFTDCIFSQGADFHFATATAGANINYIECSFVGAGIATAYGFDIQGGNVVFQRCSTLGIASELFANLASGGLTTENLVARGKINNTGGTLTLSNSLVSVTAGAALNHTSGTAANIFNTQFSSNTIGTNAITGTGTINYAQMPINNTQFGTDATLTWVPYREVINKTAVPTATFSFTAGAYQYGIETGGIVPFAWNVPTSSGYKWSVNGGAIVQLTEYGIRGATNPLIGGYVPSFKWEISGNVFLPAAEASQVDWDLTSTQNFDTGTIQLQRQFRVRAPTFSGNNPGTAFVRAAAHCVDGPASAGALTDINIAIGAMVEARSVSVGATTGSVIGNAVFQSGLANGQGDAGVIASYAGVSLGACTLGNQLASLAVACTYYGPSIQYSSVTDTRTIGACATFYGTSPSISGTVAVTSGPYAAWFFNQGGNRGTVRVDGRLLLGQGVGVVSANDLTLGTDGDYFVITNNTDIQRIATAGYTSGTIITLGFTGNLNVVNGVATGGGFAMIETEGGFNIACVSGTELMLRYSSSRGAWSVMSMKQP